MKKDVKSKIKEEDTRLLSIGKNVLIPDGSSAITVAGNALVSGCVISTSMISSAPTDTLLTTCPATGMKKTIKVEDFKKQILDELESRLKIYVDQRLAELNDNEEKYNS